MSRFKEDGELFSCDRGTTQNTHLRNQRRCFISGLIKKNTLAILTPTRHEMKYGAVQMKILLQ